MNSIEFKLNINIILDELAKYNPVSTLNKPDEIVLTAVRAFPSPDEEFQNDIIYISSYNSIAEIKTDKSPIFICCEASDEEILNNKNHNIIFIKDFESSKNLFNLLLTIFEKYHSWNQRLLNVIIYNGTKKELLDLGAEMLLNPIALFNNSLELITYAGQLPDDYHGTIWEQILEHGYTPLENYPSDYKKKLFNELSKKKSPYIYKNDYYDKHTQLNANLFIENKHVGFFGSIDINAPFTSGQQYIVDHLKIITEAFILNQNDFMFLSGSYDSMLKRMIEGYYVEEKAVAYHLRKLGWNLNSSFYLLVFENVVQDFSDQMLYKTYKYRIDQFFKNCITSPMDGYLITLLTKENYQLEQPEVLREFNKLLKGISLKCGISLEFDNFIDLNYYFRQATSAIREGKKNSEKNQNDDYCYFYHNLFLEDLVFSLGSKAPLRSFCHPKIISLKEYDINSNSEYLKTLYYYLLNGKNIASASEALYIHRNTLNYRIGRIKEIIELDIDDDKHLFHLLISCRLADFL